MTPISDERLAEMLAGVEIEFDNALLDAEADQNPQLAVDPVGEFDLIELRSILSELQSLRAQGGVRLKPLEWHADDDGIYLVSHTVAGRYAITEYPGMEQPFRLYCPTWMERKPFDTLEEARAAAQADYERRILSSLEASPAPVSEEMVEKFAIAMHNSRANTEVWWTAWVDMPDNYRARSLEMVRAGFAALTAKGGQ